MSLAIRWRLTIWIALAFAITLGAVFFSVRIVVREILDDDVHEDLSRNFRELEGRVLIRGPNPEGLAELVNDFPFPVVILEPDGGAIAANGEADAESMQPSADELEAILADDKAFLSDAEISGDEFRVQSGAVSFGNETLILQVGRSTQAIEDVMQAINTILLGGGLLALLGVLGTAYFLARSALLPVEQMTKLAAEIEASDLTRRISARRKPSEIQKLADTFDAMLARLQAAFEQQRNFVMDVSHELRTPLTGLRGNIDVQLMRKELDAEERRQLELMSSEVQRLIRLTANLLYLAHAEADREIARLPIDLDDLCLEVVHQVSNVRKDVSLRFAHEEQIRTFGDRDLIKQLVLNLVDNAVKYSPEGGEVVVSLHRKDGLAELAVADSGSGIPADQAERIFERFYRVPNSQSRTVGGAGIGLAISRWIARVHGGDIRVESNDGQGSRFVATLPAEPDVEATSR